MRGNCDIEVTGAGGFASCEDPGADLSFFSAGTSAVSPSGTGSVIACIVGGSFSLSSSGEDLLRLLLGEDLGSVVTAAAGSSGVTKVSLAGSYIDPRRSGMMGIGRLLLLETLHKQLSHLGDVDFI